MDHCEKCGKKIIWAITDKGHDTERMAVDWPGDTGFIDTDPIRTLKTGIKIIRQCEVWKEHICEEVNNG